MGFKFFILDGSISSMRFNKLLCLCHYFSRVTSKIPNGVITFERKVLTSSPSWEKSRSLFTKLHVDSQGTIELGGQGMLQVRICNSSTKRCVYLVSSQDMKCSTAFYHYILFCCSCHYSARKFFFQGQPHTYQLDKYNFVKLNP